MADPLHDFTLDNTFTNNTPGGAPSSTNTVTAVVFNQIVKALEDLKLFFFNTDGIELPNTDSFEAIIRQTLAQIGAGSQSINFVFPPAGTTPETTVELTADATGISYKVNGLERFRLALDGKVLGQVLTAIPAEINNLQTKRAPSDPTVTVTTTPQGTVQFKKGNDIFKEFSPTDPTENSVSLGWKAPLLGDNPPRIVATSGVDIPAIPARNTATVRVNFATGGFVSGGFVRLTDNYSVERILAGRFVQEKCRVICNNQSSDDLPNAGGLGRDVFRVIYVSENYLESAVFAEPNGSCYAEFDGVSARFYAGWNQSHNSVDILWGFDNTLDQGVFGIQNGKVQMNKAYLEPGLTGGTDLVIELFNTSATGVSNAVTNQNWIFQY